jgi:oligopeptide/dipeptide ABC transporter ATP-binding protein
MSLLDIRNLTLEFGTGAGAARALDGVSLSIQPGRTLGLVGESGSGKTVTALSVARLLPSPPVRYLSGEVLLDGRDVLRMSRRELREIRGGLVSYVFQEPGASLNPVFRVRAQIKEALCYHRPEAATEAEVIRLLKLVGIPAPESRLTSYPHELSGGMQQRVMIAIALASQPKLLIADEPTTALDVTIQAQIIELLRNLREQLGMAMLLITHNFGLVGELADEVAVMYAGQIVESGPASEVLHRPSHPYTQALIQSVPEIGGELVRLAAIPGNVPLPGLFPSGCRFHPRCSKAQASCATQAPGLVTTGAGHVVRCPFWLQTPAGHVIPAPP